MTISIAKCIILAILFIATRPRILIQGQVPCYFIFGDALFDNGNNNNLITIVKANYLPYGIDFFYGSTGRFTNGAMTADFIGQRFGYSRSPPPYATAGGSNAVLKGLNYAAGAGGILDETSYEVGDRIWMDRQLSNHQSTVNRINTVLGNQTAANNLLNRCLYVVSMGNTDYLYNYYFKLPLTLSALLDSPETFAQKLILKYSQQLTTLYNLGARKVAVFGVFPIGCLPNTISEFSTNGTCVERINNGVQIFNNKLISLVQNLNSNLSGAQFTYINTFAIATSNLSSIGVRVQNAPCCQVSALTLGQCVRNGNVCSNRNEYAYFDNYLPSEVLANYTASRAYNKQSATDAIPYDIATLVRS